MNITHFLKTYEKIAKQEAFEKEIDDLFLDLSSRVTGTSLEGKFEHCSDRLEKVIAIDAVAHAMHDNSRIALLLYPSAGYTEIKKKLDELSGLEAVNEVRKLNRNYFTSLLSDSEITIISKQVGITKANDIREVIKEYTALFNAEKEAGGPEMISDAELLTLSRYTKDKKYYDYWKNREREEEPLIVAGYASVEVIDKENHLITTSALRDAWDKFIKSFRTRNQQLAHCLVPGTKVWKVHGGYASIETIQPGDCVFTHLGNSKKVVKTIDHYINGNIIELSLDNGEVIQITDRHEVYTKKGWVESGNLVTEDILLTANPASVINGSKIACMNKKGKSLNEFYGVERANEIKIKISKSRIGKATGLIPKFSIIAKGKTLDKLYGIEKSNEIKEKISLSNKLNPRGFCLSGKNQSKERKGKTWTEVYGHKKPQYKDMTGWNNYLYKGMFTNICLNCGKNFQIRSSRKEKIYCSNECYRKHISIRYSGEGNPSWKESKVLKRYDRGFSKKLILQIRNRDLFSCQVCGMNEKESKEKFNHSLYVHHINYNKKDSNEKNLISLCNSCHSKTNTNKEYWESILKSKALLNEKILCNGTKIINIRKIPYIGKVYNLEVEGDNSYSGKGIIYHNSSIQVGWPLRAYINKAGEVFKSGVDDKGLYVISEIRPDIAIAQRMRKEVENGNIRSFSIAGTATDKQYKSMGGKSVMVVDGLDLAEITFCLPGREKIWTTKGLKPISDIQVGELVLTHNLNWKSVVHTMKRQVNEKLVKIATKYGTLTATSNHKIRKMVYGGKHIEAHYDWVPIKEIKVNDLISYNFPIGFGKYCEPRILSVEEVPFEGIVYNLEVEGDNSYTTEFAVVHNCESPVNQKAYFDIIKSEEIKKDENELEIVREEQLNELFDVPIRISDYTVVVVGGIIRKGSSEHDLDILIRASKDSFLGRAIRLRMSRLLKERNPEILKKTRFIYEPEGPHGSFKPLFYLSLQPINVGNIELSEDSKKELKKDVTSQQKVVLNTLRGYKVIKEHDDGDLTVESADVKYIISTDGRIFKEIGPLVQSSYSGHKLTKIIHKDGAKQEALVQLKELLKEREGGK